MKSKNLLFLIAIIFITSCSSVYKTTQTPDDLYYSPAREVTDVKVDRTQDRYEEYISSNDDRYLRMKAHNYYLWNSLDDYGYWYDSRYSYNDGWNITFNYGLRNNYYNYYYWNFWYPSYGWYSWGNPVCIVASYKNAPVTRSTAGTYLSAYKNKNFSNNNYYFNKNQDNASNSFGSMVKRVFSTNTSSGNNSSWDRPVRTFNNSNSSSGTSSNAGGNSGGYNSKGSSSSGGRGGRGN